MTEKTIVNAIIKALRMRGVYVVKIHGGPFQQMGLPDLLCISSGLAVFLEVKRPGERPTLRQVVEMEKIKQAGAVVAVVTSVDEALEPFPAPRPAERTER